MSKTVYYHHPCTDGLVAAWSLREAFGNNINFVPLAHATPLLDEDVVGKDVYFLDIVPTADRYRDVITRARKVEVADHHSTAHPASNAGVAQWIEFPASTRVVGGSSPSASAKCLTLVSRCRFHRLHSMGR